MGEPLDAPGELTADGQDAFAELFRQFAGTAAVALRALLSEEFEMLVAGGDRPTWAPAVHLAFCLTNPQIGPTVFHLWVSAELETALRRGRGAGAARAVSKPADPAKASAEGLSREINIDLLMDVELDATLRFGERQMLLRDVLELSPGAVVELDRQINDLVDLLVGSKVVARGEVVVVDGNYGLRVTEMATAQERIESLKR